MYIQNKIAYLYTHIQGDTNERWQDFLRTLFMTVENQKESKCTLSGDWLNKL